MLAAQAANRVLIKTMRRKRYFQNSEKTVDIDELKWIRYSIESEGGIFIGNNGNS